MLNDKLYRNKPAICFLFGLAGIFNPYRSMLGFALGACLITITVLIVNWRTTRQRQRLFR